MKPSCKRIFERLLLPYQRVWFDQKNRFKIGLWARQTGKDFTCMAEAVLDALLHPNTLWIVMASGERQALESLEKAKQWADVAGSTCQQFEEDRASRETIMRSAEISWDNGSRLIAIPARPQTARGYSANIILYRAAFSSDGHSDRCTALALALRAATQQPVCVPACQSVSPPPRRVVAAWG